MYSDNGTNFHRAKDELKRGIQDIDDKRIR